MAVATSVRRAAFNDGFYGTLNLYLNSGTGVTPGIPLTIGTDLIVTTVHERPNLCWKCEVTGTPRGSAHLLIDPGEVVTG